LTAAHDFLTIAAERQEVSGLPATAPPCNYFILNSFFISERLDLMAIGIHQAELSPPDHSQTLTTLSDKMQSEKR
jgi:hypothetical protein